MGFLDQGLLSAGQRLSGFYISSLPPTPSPDFCRKLAEIAKNNRPIAIGET